MWWKSHLYSNRHQKWTFRLVYFYKVSHYIYGNNLFWEINSNVSPFLRVRFFEGATPARKIVRPKHFFWLWLSQKSIWLVFGRADRGGTKNIFCPSPRSSVRKNAFSYLPVDEKVVFGNLPGWKNNFVPWPLFFEKGDLHRGPVVSVRTLETRVSRLNSIQKEKSSQTFDPLKPGAIGWYKKASRILVQWGLD